ncbi:MAG: hypothetical protein QG608_2470 [Actinomycetota bacterium]|nr:hypothetical protein [Actinomycetota bacterium]
MRPALGTVLPVIGTRGRLRRSPQRAPHRYARHRLPGRCRTPGGDPGTLRSAALVCLVLAGVGSVTETASALWSTGAVGRGWAGVSPAPGSGTGSAEPTPSPQTPLVTSSVSGLLAPGSPVRLTVEIRGRGSSAMRFGEVGLERGAPDGCTARNATVRTVGTRRAAEGAGAMVEADLFLGAAAAPACRGARFTVAVTDRADGRTPGAQITVDTSRDQRSWRVKTLRPTAVVGSEGVRLLWSPPQKADAGGPMWVEQFDTNGVWKVLPSTVHCTRRSCSATVPRDAAGHQRFRVGYRLATPTTPQPDPGTTTEDESPAAQDDGADRPRQDPRPQATEPQDPELQDPEPQDPGVEPEDGTDPSTDQNEGNSGDAPDNPGNVAPDPSAPEPGDCEPGNSDPGNSGGQLPR